MFEEFVPDEKTLGSGKKADDRRIEGYLGHYLSTDKPHSENGRRVERTRWATYELSLARPESGESSQTVPCPKCGAKLNFRIRGRDAVRTKRVKLLGGAILATGLGIALFKTGTITAGRALIDLVCIVAFFWSFYAVVQSLGTYGLSIEMQKKGSAGHELFKTLEGMTVDRSEFS